MGVIVRPAATTTYIADQDWWPRQQQVNSFFQSEVLDHAYLLTTNLPNVMMNFVDSSHFRLVDIFIIYLFVIQCNLPLMLHVAPNWIQYKIPEINWKDMWEK